MVINESVLEDWLGGQGQESVRAIQIAKEILAVVVDHHGQEAVEIECRQNQWFYLPSKWAARGERYGQNSELVVVHECNALAIFFSYDYAYEVGHSLGVKAYDYIELMRAHLETIKLYAEQCTRWYSGIYPEEQP